MHPFEKFAGKIVNFKFFLFLSLFIVFIYFFLDESITYTLYPYKNTTFVQINQYLTKLGDSLYYIIGLIVAYLFSFFILKKKTLANGILFVLLAIIISGLTCDVLKVLLGRARPVQLLDHGNYGFKFLQTKSYMWSFPSGHATTITSLMLPLMIFFRRYWVVWLIILLIISFTRVFINAHYLSDTIAGLYLGTITVYWLFKQFQSRNWFVFK